MAEKSFEELLFEGVMTALRSQALEDLYEYRDSLDEMDLPAEYLEFPTMALTLAIAEKQNQRALN